MRTESQSVLIDRTDLFQRGLRGTLVALALFVVVGTVSAVWANPFFTRMTPVGTWELAATAMLAALAGVTSAFWVRPARTAAPVCNATSSVPARARHMGLILAVRSMVSCACMPIATIFVRLVIAACICACSPTLRSEISQTRPRQRRNCAWQPHFRRPTSLLSGGG